MFSRRNIAGNQTLVFFLNEAPRKLDRFCLDFRLDELVLGCEEDEAIDSLLRRAIPDSSGVETSPDKAAATEKKKSWAASLLVRGQ